MKTHDMDADPDICLQVEEIHGSSHWRSAIVMGRAKHVTEQPEIVGVASRNENRVMALVKQRDATLSPAINRTWTDSWGRAEVISIYRLEQGKISGRTTDGVSSR